MRLKKVFLLLEEQYDEGEISIKCFKNFFTKTNRRKRSDAFDSKLMQKIADTWCNKCEMSPNIKDIVRLQLRPKSFISHVVYYKYCQTFDVFQHFRNFAR